MSQPNFKPVFVLRQDSTGLFFGGFPRSGTIAEMLTPNFVNVGKNPGMIAAIPQDQLETVYVELAQNSHDRNSLSQVQIG